MDAALPLRATEGRHPHSAGMQDREGVVVLDQLLAAQQVALAAVRAAIPAIEAAAGLAAEVLRAGGKLGYAGAGSSGLMALADALELAGTFGILPDRTPVLFAGGAAALLHMTGGVEDDPELALEDFTAAGLRAGDAVLCLSASGTTPYTLEVARLARATGVRVVGFANVAGSPLAALSDIAVTLETGPELVNGSTRMGAATAQKVALNMLSTRIGVLLGHVQDGYMVNLIADNTKLMDRAARIVSALSGQGMDAARVALSQSGGAVKPAVLIAAGAAPDRAAALISDNGGRLGPALAALTHNRP